MEKFSYDWRSAPDCPALEYDLNMDLAIYEFEGNNTEFRPLVEKCLLEAEQRRFENRPMEALSLMDLEAIPLLSNNPQVVTFYELPPVLSTEDSKETQAAKDGESESPGLDKISVIETIPETRSAATSPGVQFDSPEGWYVVDPSDPDRLQ